MSVFAGRIAADLILQRAPGEERGKIVIVGGGVVGVSCLRRLLDQNWETIVVLEKSASTCDKLSKEFKQYQGVQFRRADRVDDDGLKGAYGLLLCAFVQGERAPKVVSVNQLIGMTTGGIIVDISIDEGGSISSQGGEAPEAIREQIERLGKNLEYIADTHMPRKYPGEASEAHGEAVLPYLCVLLYLAARERSSLAAVEYIRGFSSGPSDYFSALVCDLREGLAFTGPSPITLFGVVSNKETIQQFLSNLGVECTVA